jgi:outer membrane protein TolC
MKASFVIGAAFSTALAVQAGAQTEPRPVLDLTLERMVELAMRSSYQVRQLNLSIDRTQLTLQAERARLRSRVDLQVSAPDFRSLSENLWNSSEGRYEIVRENSRRYEAELSIRQPVILFGYPTNGYLSLNNQVYRYSQLGEDGERDLRYYNRAFIEYTQPLFQPNELRNDIESAELDLENAELGFYDDVVEMVEDISDDYFELFEDAYGERLALAEVAQLESAVAAAESLAATDSARRLDLGQIRVELANARERLQQARNQVRLAITSLRTRLSIPARDSVTISPELRIVPLTIDPERAVRLAFDLTPQMRQLDIEHREEVIELNETRGRGGLQLDLTLSYGQEMRDPVFADMWRRPSNSYTLGARGQIPLWDWGERKSRIAAAEISVRQTELRREEAAVEIRASVESEIRNVAEYQSRALAMQENLALATSLSAESLTRYRGGETSVLELLQAFRREQDTGENLLDAYLGWRRALSEVQQRTFYDFEHDTPLLERFRVRTPVR